MLKQNYICPFCNSSVAISIDTQREKNCYFNDFLDVSYNSKEAKWNNIFKIYMRHCPSCNNVSFEAIGEGNLEGLKFPLYPSSLAKQYPDYIPQAIKNDYEEAYSILTLSPKASATLSRRCLQGMIRDFWNINDETLYKEINKIKDMIPLAQWKAIDSLRSLGNIGAHMDKDVNKIIEIDDGEAEQLIKLIELLMEKWYIARHDEEQLYNSIIDIKNSKKEEKN